MLCFFRSRLILAALGPALGAAHKRRAALAALVFFVKSGKTLCFFRSRLILAALGPALGAAHKRRAALAALVFFVKSGKTL